MVVPHYAYLKMKMPGPKGIIMISRDLQNAYQCDLLAIENAVRNLDPAQRELDYVLMQGQGSGGSNASSATSRFLVSTSQRKEAATSPVHGLGANRGPIIHARGRFGEVLLGENQPE